jgi:integrase
MSDGRPKKSPSNSRSRNLPCTPTRAESKADFNDSPPHSFQIQIWIQPIDRIPQDNTAFNDGRRAGIVTQNPLDEIKPGSDVHVEGQHIIPISDYEKLINSCPDSDWRTIIASARLGGLRCPSELLHLKWKDVNWDAGSCESHHPRPSGMARKSERYRFTSDWNRRYPTTWIDWRAF